MSDKSKQPPRLSVEITPKISARIDKVIATLQTSRGGLGRLAVDYVLPMIEAGELVSTNGKLSEPK